MSYHHFIPGNETLQAKLMAAAHAKNMAHALLINGAEGSGNLALAVKFAKAVLCENSTELGACGVCASCKNVDKLAHPDLHFSYPFIKGKENISDEFMGVFRKEFLSNPFLSVHDWFNALEPGKQGIISTDESTNIMKKLTLKAYLQGYKVMIIWRPEFMNASAANKLLKIIEEPPAKTLFLLVSEKREDIIATILSRCQLVPVDKPKPIDVERWLSAYASIPESKAKLVAALTEGNVGKAIHYISYEGEHNSLLDKFMQLNRLAYKRDIPGLMLWSEQLAKEGREQQKLFLHYCLHLIRLSIRANYLDAALQNLSDEERVFLEKFAPYVNHTNVLELHELFNKTHYAVVRNGNPKMTFLNLSFALIPLIHPKLQPKKAS
ncbi:MAG: DNA polymerase III subunit [Luteibaculaceae bacterium]